MTKMHPLHRKKAIHMKFRLRYVRDAYYHIQALIDRVESVGGRR
jgi:hypothetical protein